MSALLGACSIMIVDMIQLLKILGYKIPLAINNLKVCSKCNNELNVLLFKKDKTKKDGYSSSCKDCHKKLWKDNYFRIAEKHRERNSKYTEDNKQRVNDYRKQYRIENKIKLNYKQKEWKQNNPEHAKALKKAWKANKRAKHHNCVGKLNAYEIMELKQKNNNCFYCCCILELDYEIDHKHPLSRGGENVIENIVISCHDCNVSKGRKTAEEFIEKSKKIACQ